MRRSRLGGARTAAWRRLALALAACGALLAVKGWFLLRALVFLILASRAGAST